MEEQSIIDNRSITERIKTFDDALAYLEYRAEELEDENAGNLTDDWDACIYDASNAAYLRLTIITYALNEGRQPELTENEGLWHPCFVMWTADQLSQMSEEEARARGILVGNAGNGAHICVSFSHSDCEWATAGVSIGLRLAFRTQELADYAGSQFAAIYAGYYFGEKGLTAKPWREFEK